MYNNIFKEAKYIDLTHAFEPVQAVWHGFGSAKFKPAKAGKRIEGYIEAGEEFTYEKHGFVATTYAIRPLVVIDIHNKVSKDNGYHLQVEDIKKWEEKYGIIPKGSVVMVRSDWHKKWKDTERFNKKPFPE